LPFHDILSFNHWYIFFIYLPNTLCFIFILPLYFPVLPYIFVFFFFLNYFFYPSHILPPDDISWYPPPQGEWEFSNKSTFLKYIEQKYASSFVSLLILSLIIRPIYSSVTKTKYGPEVWKGKKMVLFITHGQQARILLRRYSVK
jgi:hypothetical protein